MRISVRFACGVLALVASLPLLQGCDKKQKPVQTQALAPPIVDQPPPKPATVKPTDLPPPVVGDTQPTQPPADTTAQTQEPPKKPVHHPKKPAPAPTQDTASAAPAPSVSAIGQLSSGASGGVRTETEEEINNTEKGVNAITRPLSDAETKTAAHIHEFLKQAREALATGDVDGAQTLVKKAKVLLTELNSQ
jgi:hypothetical protein